MPNSDAYRRHAAECLRLAEKATNPDEKAYLLYMANAWLNLADQADRNRKTDIVYETPPQQSPHPVVQQQQQRQRRDDEPGSD